MLGCYHFQHFRKVLTFKLHVHTVYWVDRVSSFGFLKPTLFVYSKLKNVYPFIYSKLYTYLYIVIEKSILFKQYLNLSKPTESWIEETMIRTTCYSGHIDLNSAHLWFNFVTTNQKPCDRHYTDFGVVTITAGDR